MIFRNVGREIAPMMGAQRAFYSTLARRRVVQAGLVVCAPSALGTSKVTKIPHNAGELLVLRLHYS